MDRLKLLIEKFNHIFDNVVIDPGDIDYSILNYHCRILEHISLVENSSLTIFDLFQKKYVFIRNRFIDLISYDREKGLELGYNYFFSLMHPDDVEFAIDTSLRSMEFMLGVPSGEKKDYKTIFEFRLRNKDGNYIRFIQQVVNLELDLKGNMWLILILMDLNPVQLKNKPMMRSLINLKDKRSYLFNDVGEEKHSQLTKREIEILGLLAKGMASKEIAGQLFLSVNTVNNHRQKIIEKMAVSNTSEALAYAGKLGII
jgi:DNA-binding CsgD family transcriptional regulator/PAS domain-containing protein